MDTNRGSLAPQCTVHPWHTTYGVAARAVILCPYDTCFYDIIGLWAFSSLPLVGFCWTVTVRVNFYQDIDRCFLSIFVTWMTFQFDALFSNSDLL